MYNNIELHQYLIVLPVFFMRRDVHTNSLYIGGDVTGIAFFVLSKRLITIALIVQTFVVHLLANLQAITQWVVLSPKLDGTEDLNTFTSKYIPPSQRISKYGSDFSDLPEPEVS